MPELPDVESFRRYFNRTSLNKIIENIDVEKGRMLKVSSARSLQMQLKNDEFKKTSRHAKYLFAHAYKKAKRLIWKLFYSNVFKISSVINPRLVKTDARIFIRIVFLKFASLLLFKTFANQKKKYTITGSKKI